MTNSDTFREEVRTWLAENFPDSLKDRPPAVAANAGGKFDSDMELWRRRLGERGWSAPTWPARYGGGGLTHEEARILTEEMRAIGAFNPIRGIGIMLLGPTLLDVASEEQKQRYLPPIVRGEVYWCHGYSEPSAGSDLAGLQCLAEDGGDHFVVNGSKIWTTGADKADWMYGIFRTDQSSKYEGISFICLDMKSPGVEVKPIISISGYSAFFEVSFTNVVVPKENLIGPLNQGWAIGKQLLLRGRQSISGLGAMGATSYSPVDAARDYIGVSNGRLINGALRERIARSRMMSHSYSQTTRRMQAEAAVHGPSPAVDILKVAWAKINQERLELMIEIMGNRGLSWEGEGFNDDERDSVRSWLQSKANSIEGGSTEISLNVVAKRVLGLPGY